MINRRTRRALSTVVTSAILLSAVALMGTMVVTWANMKLSGQEQALNITFSDNMNKMNEDFIIENIWYDYILNNVNVTVTNVGSIGLNITEIKFTDSSNSNLMSKPITDGGILVQQSYNTNVTYGGLTPGVPFNVVVTSERVNIVQTQVLPP